MYKKKQYFSQAQIESDQKDIIIAQLKADIFERKKNNDDYIQLQDELRKLEHRYKIALEEKVIREEEFQNRHENNIRTLQSYKGDCQQLQQEINSRNQDIQELQLDNSQQRQICDQKAYEIQRVKHFIESEIQKQEQLNDNNTSGKDKEDNIKNDRRNLLIQLDGLKLNIQEMNQKQSQLEKLNQDLETQQNRITRQLQSQDKENQLIEDDVKRKDQELKEIEKANQDIRRNIQRAEQELQNNENQFQKNKNEVRHYNIVLQNEIQRNQELIQRIQNLETLAKNKENHISNIKADIEEITEENKKVMVSNEVCQKDLQGCKNHKQSLQKTNKTLLMKLHKQCDLDDQIREIFNRRGQLDVMNKHMANSRHDAELMKSFRSSRKQSPSKYQQSYYEQ